MPPRDTLARIGPVARAIGVTRLGDITGLDRIGIPVFQAVRPSARALSVSQGKGATADAARVSALMEAIEVDHAERVLPTGRGPATAEEGALWARMTVADDQPEPFDPMRPRAWVDGIDLLSGHGLRVPHELVSLDFAAPIDPDVWPNTNGLASGNDPAEAQLSALCELVERDAYARWHALTPSQRSSTAIDRATIDDRLGRALIARVARADCDLTLWDMTGPHRVATIGCVIVERATDSAMLLPPAFGAGCHPDAAVALSRAITEAAQTRGTLIAGAREDVGYHSYEDPAGRHFRLMLAHRDFADDGTRPWRAVPNARRMSIAAHRDALVAAIAAVGAPVLAAIDLTRPEFGVSVVKLIVPGFGDHDRPSAL